MTQFEQEALFARMARAYVTAEGAALLAEAAALPAPPATPRMDTRVRRAARRGETGRWAAGLALLAAGFLAVLLVGRGWMPLTPPPPAATAPSVSAPSTAAPPASGETDGDLTTNNLINGSTAAPPASGETVGLIPLGFTLPENLTVSRAEEDRGQSIYHLTDTGGDDVVLTMQAGGAPDLSDLRAVLLGGRTVYGRSEGGYHLLAFEEEGVYYELTCKYEMQTLTTLAEYILL